MMGSSELYACLYAKEFPAQALLRLRPELHAKPCVVLDGEPPFEYVVSLNAKARQAGMCRGMTRVEVVTFTKPIVLSRSLRSEASTQAILLECAGAFSPRIDVSIEDGSASSAFLCGVDLAGTSRLFGPPAMLARSLLDRIRAHGITARVVISRNLHAASCLAKDVTHTLSIRVIAEGEEAAALAPLPLSVLGLSEINTETFALWGIRTLGMLAALPENELIARLGQQGKRLRQLARSELRHHFLPVEPPSRLEEQMELDAPVDSLEALLFVVSILLEQLILRASIRILALASVTVTLGLEGNASHIRTVRPALPSSDKQLWIKLIHLDLEAHPATASALSVALFAEPGETSKVQLGLFSPQLPEASRLEVTLARIRAIVGEENVGRPVLQDTHGLESFRVEAFTLPSTNSTMSGSPQIRATLRQLRPAEPLCMTLRNMRPARFFFRQRLYVVEHAYGPWLAGGEWWSETLWGLEQWDLVARAQDGSVLCCCTLRDLMQNHWQMAAFYD